MHQREDKPRGERCLMRLGGRRTGVDVRTREDEIPPAMGRTAYGRRHDNKHQQDDKCDLLQGE